MSTSPKDFLQDLYNKRADYKYPSQAYTAARLLKTVSADIYSESQRFLFELIQNADDAALGTENEVHFKFLPGFLVACHRGKPFTAADIEAITDADASTKTADPTKTGYKGIGFKSVFARSKQVFIWSGGYQFKFDQQASPPGYPWQVIPVWVEADELPAELAHFVAQETYTVYTCLALGSTTDLEADLAKLLNPQLLLFLRRVGRISVAATGQPDYAVARRRTELSAAYQQVELLDQQQHATTWLLKIFDQLAVPESLRQQLVDDEKTPEKLRLATVTEVAFAARVADGKLVALPADESRLYTYLPTEETGFSFPFLANGTFLTTSSRQSLHTDSRWNQWLFGVLATKLLDWLQLLASTGYALQLLTLLPRRFNSGVHVLKQCFDQGINAAIGQRQFVVGADLKPHTIAECLLDETGLARLPFLAPATLLAFWAAQAAGSTPPTSFVHPEFAHAARLDKYGLAAFRLEDVEAYFRSAVFTTHHAVADNFALIAYFQKKAAADASGEWLAALPELPFIYDEAQILRVPADGVCFPAEVGESSTELGAIPVIHPQVFEQLQKEDSLLKWLEKLGVQRPSEVAYVTNVLVPALRAGETVITAENYLTVTNYLFRLHREGKLSSDLVEALRELPLKTSDGSFKAAQFCYLASAYHPLLALESVIEDLPFVSDDYLGNAAGWLEWQQFFRRLKVKDRIELEAITANNSLTALATITHPTWLTAAEAQADRKSNGGFGFGSHNQITGLLIPSFLNLTASNPTYSKLFWQTLLKQEITPAPLIANITYHYGAGRGRNSYRVQIDPYFTWFVAEQPCIPTTTGELLPAREVLLNNKDTDEIARNYLPVFDCSIRPTQQWRDVLKLRVQLQTSDYLLILRRIAAEGERRSPGQRVLKTIGLVYKALSHTAHSGTTEDVAAIKEWGTQNYLLSNSMAFERPADLLLIKLAGFADLAGQVKSLYLPTTIEKDSAEFAALLELFGVRIVDSYTPNVRGAQPEFSLKKQLLALLPTLVALHEKKQYVDFAESYRQARQQVLQTTFFQADSVRLCFTDKGRLVESDPLDVLREPPAFFFTTAWNSALALYWLLPELENLLFLPGLRQELNLLLQLPLGEAQRWLATQGIDAAAVLARCHALDAEAPMIEETTAPVPAYATVAPAVTALPPPPFAVESSWSFQPTVTPGEAASVNGPVGAGSWRPPVSTAMEPPIISNSTERLPSEADRSAIGRWSEEFVRDRLVREPGRFSVVEWQNEKGESGRPYDFRVVDHGVEKYLEVKGTPSASKGECYFSAAEWRLLFAQQEHYAVYRVFEAGQPTARAEVEENPSKRLHRGELLPQPIVLIL
ncbi:MAG: sacsin N-terminal ATP-binding-like domain-containing protein [Janthinobacterium lividum]